MKKLFGLGKGLNSLIPSDGRSLPLAKKENIFYVEVSKIESNPEQPRQDFDKDSMEDLAASVRRYGILQPLLVTKVEKKSVRGMEVNYQLVAGERRLRAAKLAGLPHVPVIIRDDFDAKKDKLEVALIENLQREDLNPIEEAEAYERLSKEFGLTQQEIGQKVSKKRETVANAIRLLNLPADIRAAVKEGRLGKAHAKALLSFSNAEQQRRMYEQILTGTVVTKDVEKIATESKTRKYSKRFAGKFIELEKNLASTLAAPVMIQPGVEGGKIVVKFTNHEDLNRIAKTIID